MTISEIKEQLSQVNELPSSLLNQLKSDERKGVQKLVARTIRRIKKLNDKKHDFNQRLKYEHEFWRNGIENVAGIDEVGRGPLAGPVVTCAVILPHNFNLLDVNDSKKLSPQKRLALYPQILDQVVSVSLGIASNQKIDDVNIYQATRLAMLDAVENLSVKPDTVLIDAMKLDMSLPQTELFHGDAKSVTIGAASIIAKVYRDKLMDQYGQEYPEYGFDHNAGYGTKQHLIALKKYGLTPIHRRSFAPVANIIKNS